MKLYLVGHTGPPEGHSFPWHYSGDKVPSHYASGLLKTGVEIRRSQVVQGTRTEASEGCACTLEEIGREISLKYKILLKSHSTQTLELTGLEKFTPLLHGYTHTTMCC